MQGKSSGYVNMPGDDGSGRLLSGQTKVRRRYCNLQKVVAESNNLILQSANCDPYSRLTMLRDQDS